MTALNRTLGLPMLTFYGTGMILGAGIYSIIGKAAAETQDTLWMGFILAGVSALLTALSYAELSTMFPKAGAEFVYLREAFPKKKWIGSTIGVVMAFSGAATAATVALAFGGYLGQFFSVSNGLVAFGILILFTAISIIGIKASGWATVISTLIEVGGLLLIIYFGFTSDKFYESISFTPHLGTVSGAALIIFSFFGFENIANLVEEAKKPERDLPRAILLSVAISTTLYVLVSLSAIALLSPEKLANSTAPLMSVAQVVSLKAATILGVVALFSTANTALISLIGASRIIYGMGTENALPKVTAKVLTKRKTPWMASILVFLVAILLLPLGKLEVVAGVSSLATMIAFLFVNVALILLRFTRKKQKRPFRVPFSVAQVPVLPVLGAIFSLVLITQFSLPVYLIGGAFITVTALLITWRDNK